MNPEKPILPLPTPEDIIQVHGLEAAVATKRDQEPMTLGQALRMEAIFCSAADIARQDPLKRSRYLLGMLASGNSIDGKYLHLLEPLFRDPS